MRLSIICSHLEEVVSFWQEELCDSMSNANLQWLDNKIHDLEDVLKELRRPRQMLLQRQMERVAFSTTAIENGWQLITE